MSNEKTVVPSGLILFHKPPGITSFDALRDIKRSLGTGKVGHTGTLDKFAEGLMLVLTGRALKLSRWFTHCDKQYEGTICFGAETDTLDPEGSPIASAPLPSREAVEQVLPLFIGTIEQAPPAFSAIHIDGERASVLARRGEAPEMQKRPVTIHALELRSWDPPFATIFVHCSSGTYIRSLARDIALAAGSRAHLSQLVRTQVAGFKIGSGEWGCGNAALGSGGSDLEDTVKPSMLRDISNPLLPTPYSPLPINKAIFRTLGLPCLEIAPADAQKMIQGKPLAGILAKAPQEPLRGEHTAAAVFCGSQFIAMIERHPPPVPSPHSPFPTPQCGVAAPPVPNWTYAFVYARN